MLREEGQDVPEVDVTASSASSSWSWVSFSLISVNNSPWRRPEKTDDPLLSLSVSTSFAPSPSSLYHGMEWNFLSPPCSSVEVRDYTMWDSLCRWLINSPLISLVLGISSLFIAICCLTSLSLTIPSPQLVLHPLSRPLDWGCRLAFVHLIWGHELRIKLHATELRRPPPLYSSAVRP